MNKISKYKKNDHVMVMIGKDKGRPGNILSINREECTAVVSGVNIKVLHTKKEITTKEGPIHLSNLQLIDPSTGKPGKIGFRYTDGNKERVFKKTNHVLDVIKKSKDAKKDAVVSKKKGAK